MPKNDNPHALRLLTALREHVGEEAATAFAKKHSLSKSADVDRKFCWAQEICTALSDAFAPETATSVRRACRCGDGATMAKEISACIRKAGSLAEGCALFSQKNKYAFLEYVDAHTLIFGYHACVCSCIKRAAGNVPMLWCECSAGYVDAMFRQVFGETVSARMQGTVKSGAPRCTFLIHW